MEDKAYNSKGQAVFFSLAAGVIAVACLTPPMPLGVGALSAVLCMTLVLIFSYPCKYTLTENSLKIKGGIICITIPYKEISKASSGLSALCSLNAGYKLHGVVIYKNTGLFRKIGISPQNQEEFLKELEQRINKAKYN